MCGILGVVKFDGSPVDERLLARMRDSMLHRGPDDGGLYVREGVGLAHRRLSIVDLSPDGHQPMCNEDGTVWLSFNGEIYNYVELAARLKQRGHQFRSHTDTEVIIHLYEEMGERCLQELNGMFSFVIWDSRRQRLFGARDRMGIKPFNYYSDARQFICASEIKAILEDPSVRRAADPRGVADYLFAGSPLAGKTFFDGISELPPGHAITVENGRIRVEKYWDVRYDYRHDRSEAELTSELEALIDDAVRIHCRSDAPVGAHLSGGIDSSTVAAFAARHLDGLKSFSIRFDGGDYYDETRFAKIVSRAVGTEYHEKTASPDMLADLFASLVWHMDQPPAGGADAGFSYYAAASLAAEHVKVALTGHGGDEIFAGYPAQFELGVEDRAAFATVRPADPGLGLAARVARVLGSEGPAGILRRLSARLSPPPVLTPEDRWIRMHCGGLPSENLALDSTFRSSLRDYSPREDYLRPFSHAPTGEMLDRCLYHDLRVFLPQLLHKEDRASMAVSIESRVPLLDYRIVELMATVPPAQKIPGNVPKGLLRRAGEGRVPQEITGRRDKVPFAIPIKDWLGTVLAPLAREIALSPACLDRGVYDADLIRRGQLQPGELLGLLNVELWYRIYIDQDPIWCAQVHRASAATSSPVAA